MYPSLDKILHLELPVVDHGPDFDEEATITARFTGRLIDDGDEYVIAVNGLCYPVTFGPGLDEGQPESYVGRDVQIVAEITPGTKLFENEFEPIHIIEIIR